MTEYYQYPRNLTHVHLCSTLNNAPEHNLCEVEQISKPCLSTYHSLFHAIFLEKLKGRGKLLDLVSFLCFSFSCHSGPGPFLLIFPESLCLIRSSYILIRHLPSGKEGVTLPTHLTMAQFSVEFSSSGLSCCRCISLLEYHNKIPETEWLNNRPLFSHNSRNKMLAKLTSFEVSLLDLQRWPSSLCVFIWLFPCVCICPNLLFLYENRS